MDWIELILPVTELVDEVAALLAQDESCAGVEIRGNDVVMWAPAETATLAIETLRNQVTQLRDAGFLVRPEEVRAVPAAPEAEWRDAWKRYFRITRVTNRIVIVPSWERFAPAPSDIVLDLDPGRAFGTGAHASTRLCLIELENLCDQERLSPRRFLDVGTGSGILSIAAAKLWPVSTGAATDVDPQALDAASENLGRNGVAARVRVSNRGLDDFGEKFDVIVANIQADVLELQKTDLARLLADSGFLILSGVLAEQTESLAEAFRKADLQTIRVTERAEDREWRALVLKHD